LPRFFAIYRAEREAELTAGFLFGKREVQMLLLAASLLWTIYATTVYVYTNKEGKTVSESKTEADPKHSFPTYNLCMKEIDEQLALWEWQGLVQRVGKYETRPLTPMTVEMTTRWECRELP
jgi:hypothetical protein